MHSSPTLAYISQIRWPSQIPAGPFNASYAVAMAHAGVDVHLIVRSSVHRPDETQNDPYDVLTHEYGHSRPDNLHIHVIPTAGWKPASDTRIYFYRANRLLKKLRHQHGINCVMSRDTRALPLLARWSRRGLVAVHDSHNFYMDLSERDEPKVKKNYTYQYLERGYLPRLDGLIPLLDVQARLYRKRLKIPIKPLHPGLNEIREPNPGRFEKKTIGYVGSLSGIKGPMDILTAFQELHRSDTKLILIGGRGQEETNQMRRTIADMGLKGQVEVTGWLPVPELHERLSQVSVALLPLRDTFYNRYLTAPSKLFDYLAQAVPVIASDLPAVRELAGDAALYVPPGDRSRLTQAMQVLLDEPDRHAVLTSSAHNHAKGLLWDRRGADTRLFLEDLLRKK